MKQKFFMFVIFGGLFANYIWHVPNPPTTEELAQRHHIPSVGNFGQPNGKTVTAVKRLDGLNAGTVMVQAESDYPFCAIVSPYIDIPIGREVKLIQVSFGQSPNQGFPPQYMLFVASREIRYLDCRQNHSSPAAADNHPFHAWPPPLEGFEK